MSNFFLCPHCEGHLKVGDYIIFATRTSGKNRGLLLLHPEVGNYSSLKHPSFSFKKGDSLEFFCPLCQTSLASDIDKNLAHVLMIDEQPGRWVVRQTFDDPNGDHDWGISAEVDLAASDEEGVAVVRVTGVDSYASA